MSRKHSTAMGVGTALAGAAVAAFLSMGTAHADDTLAPDGYTDLGGGGSLPESRRRRVAGRPVVREQSG